jgi:hypothetical protein
MLRQPSGGAEVFGPSVGKLRAGHRPSKVEAVSPEMSDVQAILDLGITEEQLQTLKAAGYQIIKIV